MNFLLDAADLYKNITITPYLAV